MIKILIKFDINPKDAKMMFKEDKNPWNFHRKNEFHKNWHKKGKNFGKKLSKTF
jgi:hypothetical protein